MLKVTDVLDDVQFLSVEDSSFRASWGWIGVALGLVATTGIGGYFAVRDLRRRNRRRRECFTCS